MRKLIVYFICMLTSAGVFAQNDTSDALVGLLEAGDFQALAVTADERYLIVADAATEQVRFYSLADVSAPTLAATVDVEGAPLALAAARGVILVSVAAENDTGTLEVIAPARYSNQTRFVGGVNFIDLPFTVRGLSLASDLRRGIAYGSDQYALFDVAAPGNIDTQVFEGSFTAALLGSATVITATDGQLSAFSLSDPSETSIASIDLTGVVSAFTRSSDGSLGAAALASGQVVIFDMVSLDIRATVDLALPADPQIALASSNGALLLAALTDARTVTLVDVTSQPRILDLQLQMDGPIVALTTFTDHLVTTDGDQVAIFRLP